MAERGVFVDHSTLHRWSMKILPVLAAAFRWRKRPVGLSWRMDETYVKVAGQWKVSVWPRHIESADVQREDGVHQQMRWTPWKKSNARHGASTVRS